MLHKHLLDFTRKYNKEFAIKGYSKLKKGELQTKIESVLNKQRKEIKEEYKQLKETKAEPAKKTPVKKETKPKPAPKKAEPKKETKPVPVKKETNKNEELIKYINENIKLLTPSEKKIYEEAIKDINTFTKELKIIENKMKKGTKERFENRIKVANKRISIAEKELTKLKNSIKASNKREEPKKAEPKKAEPKKEEPKKEEPKPAPKQEQPKSNEKVDDLLFKIENNPNYNDNYNTLVKFLQKTKDKNIFPLELTFAFSQNQNEENFKALDSNPKLFMNFMAEIAKSIKDNNDLNFNILKKYDKKPSKMSVKSQNIIMKELKDNSKI